MSQIQKGIFGALAIGLTFGAVQLASGHDLIGRQAAATATAQTAVNRAAKVDRAAVPSVGSQTRTVALKLGNLPDTSVLVRVPVRKDEARNRPATPPSAKPTGRTIACEPVVSVLTDVAKLLQPGRCIT
ncbi:hypothetical protein JQ604_40045 [Bradyrhizobium jicamae]|uniref:hypothetical protein n=1 Tax=Bradyrhizobium jicamae TaxID=280332 RepID=UPI001BAD2A01|nr:hypothetical protein [Bradyrhizobium jicamae]MBR0758408.1 hypothetical protein [Bradyrhizobium jicamae]